MLCFTAKYLEFGNGYSELYTLIFVTKGRLQINQPQLCKNSKK